MENVLFEKKGNIAIVTINRPKALNALNSAVLKDLAEAFTMVEEDESIHVAILTGAGDKSFVAGADIGEMLQFSAIEGKRFGDLGNKVFLMIENCTKPFIAAINGFALGGGCEISMACDIRIASENAMFGQPEVGLGITPGFGGTQRMPRIVGYGKAMELILTAKTIKAAEAERIGLVNKVVPAAELMAEAEKMANAIIKNAPIAVYQSKRCIRRGMQCDIQTGLAYEAEAFGLCCSTADKKEGMGAFVEKRKEKTFIGK